MEHINLQQIVRRAMRQRKDWVPPVREIQRPARPVQVPPPERHLGRQCTRVQVCHVLQVLARFQAVVRFQTQGRDICVQYHTCCFAPTVET
eukprot:3292207-Pyramimonas_sp.AAC.1